MMTWRHPCDKPLSKTMMLRLSTHIYVTRSQWVNPLRPRQNGCHFADDTLNCIFLNQNVRTSIKISLKFAPKGPTSNGSWWMGIKGEMSGTVCVTFTWDMHIYMSCLWPLFLLLFVHYCNLMVCVVFWVGKWQSRGSTGMFGNLMAIYHIMLQFIQNHSRFVMLMIWK